MNRHESLVMREVEKQRQLKISEKEQLARDRKEYKQKIKRELKEQNCTILEHPVANLNARAIREHLTAVLPKKYPTNPDDQNDIARELYKWVMREHPNSYPRRLDEFAIANGLNFYHFRQMAATNNFFREIYEFCGNVVSQRVYNSWEINEIDSGFARDFLFEHDRTFAERHHRLTALKNQDNQERPKQIVEVMEIRNCPEVPERKKE